MPGRYPGAGGTGAVGGGRGRRDEGALPGRVGSRPHRGPDPDPDRETSRDAGSGACFLPAGGGVRLAAGRDRHRLIRPTGTAPITSTVWVHHVQPEAGLDVGRHGRASPARTRRAGGVRHRCQRRRARGRPLGGRPWPGHIRVPDRRHRHRRWGRGRGPDRPRAGSPRDGSPQRAAPARPWSSPTMPASGIGGEPPPRGTAKRFADLLTSHAVSRSGRGPPARSAPGRATARTPPRASGGRSAAARTRSAR